jgi:hypothetical protein
MSETTALFSTDTSIDGRRLNSASLAACSNSRSSHSETPINPFDTRRAHSTYSSRRLTDQPGGGLAATALKLLVLSASLRIFARCVPAMPAFGQTRTPCLPLRTRCATAHIGPGQAFRDKHRANILSARSEYAAGATVVAARCCGANRRPDAPCPRSYSSTTRVKCLSSDFTAADLLTAL